MMANENQIEEDLPAHFQRLAVNPDHRRLLTEAATWQTSPLVQWVVSMKLPITPRSREMLQQSIRPYSLGQFLPQSSYLVHTHTQLPFPTLGPLAFLKR